jgi:hypothetical protein
MQSDLVRNRQSAFGYDVLPFLSGVVCSQDRIRSRSLPGSRMRTRP